MRSATPPKVSTPKTLRTTPRVHPRDAKLQLTAPPVTDANGDVRPIAVIGSTGTLKVFIAPTLSIPRVQVVVLPSMGATSATRLLKARIQPLNHVTLLCIITRKTCTTASSPSTILKSTTTIETVVGWKTPSYTDTV